MVVINFKSSRHTYSRWWGILFRLRVTIVGNFYCLILLKLLHVSVLRPSWGRNILATIYSTDNGSVVFRLEYNLLQRKLNFFFIAFIVCNIPFTVCVALSAVLCLSVVCNFVCCLIIVPLSPGINPFAVQLNNNNNNNNTLVIYKVSKLAYRIWVILIANKRVKKKSFTTKSCYVHGIRKMK
jgi:hypothetical protein